MTIRSRFDRQLEKLNTALLEMGAMVEDAISRTCDAIKKKDIEQAKSVVEGDDAIDDKEKEVESICLKLLLQQQPVASDLRLITTALKIITDLERIADHAVDISRFVIELGMDVDMGPANLIPKMADASMKIVSESLDAYIKKDLSQAQKVIQYDDVVDDLFDTVKDNLIKRIREHEDTGEHSIYLLMIAKYFERIGDHAVNIAEWVDFSLTGRHKHRQIL